MSCLADVPKNDFQLSGWTFSAKIFQMAFDKFPSERKFLAGVLKTDLYVSRGILGKSIIFWDFARTIFGRVVKTALYVSGVTFSANNFFENFAIDAARIGKSIEKKVYILSDWFYFRIIYTLRRKIIILRICSLCSLKRYRKTAYNYKLNNSIIESFVFQTKN